MEWPRLFSNTAVVTALVNLVARKLGFLQEKLAEEAEGVGALAMRSMVDNANSLCLIKECHDLEGFYGIKFTDEILKYEIVSLKTIKKKVNNLDTVCGLDRCRVKAPLLARVVTEWGS